MTPKVIALYICLGVLLFSCTKREKTQRAFYFWKSAWEINAYEEQMLDSLHTSKVYVKLFDVTWNPQKASANPAAKLTLKDSLSSKYQYVPVVYITNEALLKTTAAEIPGLALKIHELTQLITNKINLTYSEIQFDCDWSDLSKENYFLLLAELRKQYKKPVVFSATIRLHQIKYYKRTGIPPVDRGMLMYYNMGKVGDLRSVNSIYNKTDAEKYTDHISDYPLPCDVALPIFRWGVLFQHGKIAALINLLTEKDLIEAGFTKNSNGYYSPPKAMYFKGYYLEPDNLIRLEEITPALAMEAAQLVAKEIPHHDITVSLYHLEPEYLKAYGKENLEKIYHSFE